jgi:hypothetical protein
VTSAVAPTDTVYDVPSTSSRLRPSEMRPPITMSSRPDRLRARTSRMVLSTRLKVAPIEKRGCGA